MKALETAIAYFQSDRTSVPAPASDADLPQQIEAEEQQVARAGAALRESVGVRDRILAALAGPEGPVRDRAGLAKAAADQDVKVKTLDLADAEQALGQIRLAYHRVLQIPLRAERGKLLRELQKRRRAVGEIEVLLLANEAQCGPLGLRVSPMGASNLPEHLEHWSHSLRDELAW